MDRGDDYFMSQLCCDSRAELEVVVGLLAGFISCRVHPGLGVTSRKVLVKLLRDAEKWRNLKEALDGKE